MHTHLGKRDRDGEGQSKKRFLCSILIKRWVFWFLFVVVYGWTVGKYIIAVQNLVRFVSGFDSKKLTRARLVSVSDQTEEGINWITQNLGRTLLTVYHFPSLPFFLVIDLDREREKHSVYVRIVERGRERLESSVCVLKMREEDS